MTSDLTPHAALEAAAIARDAAERHPRTPAWYPAVSGITYAAALSLIGAGWLMHGGAARAVSFTGAGVVVVFLALMTSVVGSWRRAGVVPRCAEPRIALSRRWSSVWTAVLSVALGTAAWVATGQVGWGTIVMGVLLGAETWYRLAAKARA